MSATSEHRRKVALKHRGWAHGEVRPFDIRTGDTVVVIAGKDKGKRGTVLRTVPETQRIVVQGVNILKRHVRAGVKGAVQGGIVDYPAPIAYSNVLLVCNRCDKPTRISRTVHNERSVIVCKNCGENYERSPQ